MRSMRHFGSPRAIARSRVTMRTNINFRTEVLHASAIFQKNRTSSSRLAGTWGLEVRCVEFGRARVWYRVTMKNRSEKPENCHCCGSEGRYSILLTGDADHWYLPNQVSRD